jgi:hypothetical protein
MRKVFLKTQTDIYNFTGYVLACHLILDYEEAL